MAPTATGTDKSPRLDPHKQALLAPPGPVPPQTFELGLVLGGTVSAGTYTAGALDLLLQALDAFQARNGGRPPHQVMLQRAAGSSGGAVCAALLGVSLNRKFTHVGADQAALNVNGAGPVDNMFWDAWVNRLSFLPMLENDDLVSAIHDPGTPRPPVQHVPALLNAKPIDANVAAVVAYANQPGDVSRPWAATPFRLAMTVCNLRGMPYKIEAIPTVGTFSGSAFVQHDDYAWFALPNVLGQGDGAITDRKPNEFWLSSSPRDGLSFSYQVLGDYARASGSMPVGLPARSLQRPAEHYLYRPYGRIDDEGRVQTAWPAPDWTELADVRSGLQYSFTGVDGGTLNNDPVKILHEALTGIGKQNPRQADQANRAMLMIDPLVDKPSTVDQVGLSVVASASALLNTFVGGARYLTADLDLFRDQDVFSRFQLVPTRTGMNGEPFAGDTAPTDSAGKPLTGEAALAGSDLFALGGWFARPFRVHDFLLGRLNMAAYLRRQLILRGDNPLFTNWSPGDVADCCTDANGKRIAVAADKSDYYLPVIPMPPDNFGVTAPTWPNGAFDPSQLLGPIEKRTEGVLGKLRADNLPGVAGWLIALIALGGVSKTIASDIVSAVTKTMAARKLWPPTAVG